MRAGILLFGLAVSAILAAIVWHRPAGSLALEGQVLDQPQRAGTQTGAPPQATEPSGNGVQTAQSPARWSDVGRSFLDREQSQLGARLQLLPEGARSVLNVPGRMRHGEFVWNERNVPAGPVIIRVDTRTQLMSVFRAGHEIGTAVILYGTEANGTPHGRFPVKDKRRDYHSRTYDAPMPFSLWLTDDGVAVHGSDVRWGRATHGCVGLPLDFAQKVFDAASVGTPVEIYRSDPQLIARHSRTDA